MKPVITSKKNTHTQRNSQSDRQYIIKKTSIKIKKKSRHDTVEYENPETILWKKGSYTAISCFCPQLAGRGARKLVIVKWLQTMILYCWNITYHRKLHLISSSRHNPLGSCGQSSSSRLFAPCYHRVSLDSLDSQASHADFPVPRTLGRIIGRAKRKCYRLSR